MRNVAVALLLALVPGLAGLAGFSCAGDGASREAAEPADRERAAVPESEGSPGSASAAQPGSTMGHESIALHGGRIHMAGDYHFETLYLPQSVRIYVYSIDGMPMGVDEATGHLRISHADGDPEEVALTRETEAGGLDHYCASHPDGVAAATARCGHSAQEFLLGVIDLSDQGAWPVNIEFHLDGLQGSGKEITFSEPFEGVGVGVAAPSTSEYLR